MPIDVSAQHSNAGHERLETYGGAAKELVSTSAKSFAVSMIGITVLDCILDATLFPR